MYSAYNNAFSWTANVGVAFRYNDYCYPLKMAMTIMSWNLDKLRSYTMKRIEKFESW